MLYTNITLLLMNYVHVAHVVLCIHNTTPDDWRININFQFQHVLLNLSLRFYSKPPNQNALEKIRILWGKYISYHTATI